MSDEVTLHVDFPDGIVQVEGRTRLRGEISREDHHKLSGGTGRVWTGNIEGGPMLRGSLHRLETMPQWMGPEHPVRQIYRAQFWMVGE